MPPLEDPVRIRNILEPDRPWTAYALADLEPEQFPHTRWCVPSGDDSGLVLLFTAFDIPVVLGFGAPDVLRALIDEAEASLAPQCDVHFVTRPEVLPVIAEQHEIRSVSRMLRMILDHAPPPRVDISPAIETLGREALDSLRALYADGDATGEAPDFFMPSMLDAGTFRGIREEGELVAAAGTHVVAPTVGVAAVGAVYTRRDRRARGHASRVTSAVVAHLQVLGIGTIVLNVAEENQPAIRVYRQLGFRPYCSYHEVVATRRSGHAAGT